MAAVKQGLLRFPAFALCGELAVVNIGLKADLPGYQSIAREVVDDEMVRNLLPKRPVDAHKGTFGTALIVAGSVNYTGAALLAGKAAIARDRPGDDGRCRTAVSRLAGQFPECIWLLLPHEMGVIAAGASDLVHKNAAKATALLLGPGWGLEEPTYKFLARLLESGEAQGKAPGALLPQPRGGLSRCASPAPMVVDADGLKLLARIPNWYELLPKTAVLTPHPGEMSILAA